MPANIKLNNVKSIRFRCNYDKYYDFMLYKGERYGDGSFGNCIAADITPYGVADNGKVYSTQSWPGAVSEGLILKDIGLTGIDNGFISYRKDAISNQEFVDILTGSTYTIDEGDKRFFLSPVSGNTQTFVYPTEIQEDEKGKYFALKGGFYQGFFKLFGYDYQTLPSYIDNSWNLSFVLRRRSDYELDADTLNNLHPENAGIFFYMGTRAENKFWHLYKTEGMEEFYIDNAVEDGYFEDWDLENYVTDYDYVADENNPDEEFVNEVEVTPEYSLDPEYWQKEIDLSKVDVSTSDGYELDKKGYYEIETDNKFIFFNRTSTGFTVNNWDEDTTVVLSGRTDWEDENYFITFNRTCTGRTVNDADAYNEKHTTDYDIFKDIKNNSFALKINEDGSIGYRMGVLDCEEEKHHYSVKEEYSKPGIVPMDEWVSVNVEMRILNPVESQCITNSGTVMTKVSTKVGERKMKIYIYVNGYLVFVSKELPEFAFKELNDVYQKQEGVPFNLSLGGGTQGLLEEVFIDYYKTSDYCLPIEKNFAGSFIGDIRSFKFYPCFMDYPTIKKMSNV